MFDVRGFANLQACVWVFDVRGFANLQACAGMIASVGDSKVGKQH